MKILCLHGREQSGKIFQAQLSAVINVVQHAETKVSFEFADAPIQCAKSSLDGQAVYKFFDASIITEICMAHEWLARKLTADGPYDGVIGFSQGATLVSSHLLYRQWYNYDDTTPFKFAIFISGSLSLVVLKDLGVPVPVAAERVVEETELRRQADLGPFSPHVSLARQAIFNSDDCFGLNLNRVPLELKIRIPTIHIWGVDDPGFPTSVHLAGLCDPYIRKIYTHGGAHEIPQETGDIQELGQLFLWCMQRAIWPGHLEAH
ncbi:serine hydrolase FSH [Xylaria sp. FL1042]|nr:serine hydrolase FSH [Xylaria sp. FL1042]